jgi:hypothetical protein
MTNKRFDRHQDTPAIRSALDAGTGKTCPFCGGQTLIISNSDLDTDRDRVEVYCNNTYCDAREIIILITRGDGANLRADVTAINAVDEGTREELEAEGVEVMVDADGYVIGTTMSPDSWTPDLDGGNRTYERRIRPTRIKIKPVSNDEPDHA